MVQIKSFIILALLRRSVSRVGWPHDDWPPQIDLERTSRKPTARQTNLTLFGLVGSRSVDLIHISALFRQGSTAPFEEVLQRWRVVGNTLFNFTGPKFEPQTPAPETNALPLDQLAGRFCCNGTLLLTQIETLT